jgi:hypothetical protein
LSGAVHVERQQNGDEELFRPPLLVNDLAAVAKLVMSGRQAWAIFCFLFQITARISAIFWGVFQKPRALARTRCPRTSGWCDRRAKRGDAAAESRGWLAACGFITNHKRQ